MEKIIGLKLKHIGGKKSTGIDAIEWAKKVEDLEQVRYY